MNASEQAYEFLETRHEGGYEGLCLAVLERGGTMVQAPDFFLAFAPEGRVAHILFACGDIRKLIAYGKAVAGVHGVDLVKWERSLVGKHEGSHEFKISKLPNL